ncbi:MAG: hypothetical protein SFU27_13960 [Thermonemataceae bacterium]|nr:hypothetical protein [Thermonemataceae bacterium]
MAAHYIGIMAQKLMLFDESLTEEQAEALAWVGLYDAKPELSTIAYKNLSQTEREEIEQELDFIRANFPKNCP